jgi:glyceraldehyde 3-phosphate dehydrogenase
VPWRIDRVVLTAPGKGKLKNIVHGINHGEITADDKIVSAASCTTNAIVPVLKAVNDKFGIVNGHVETVHSYTNDQNLIDNFHKGDRRGRSCRAEHGDHRDRCCYCCGQGAA